MNINIYKIGFSIIVSVLFTSCNNNAKPVENTETIEVKKDDKLTLEKQDVLNAILRLHDGMRQKDGDLAASAWLEKASSYNINIDSLGTIDKVLDSPQVNIENIRTWLNKTKDDLNEEIFNIEIFIDGDLAMAWVPYNFYRNKAFSHSGTNAFTLVKVDGVWKIISVTDTRYFDKTKEYK